MKFNFAWEQKVFIGNLFHVGAGGVSNFTEFDTSNFKLLLGAVAEHRAHTPEVPSSNLCLSH